MRRLSYLFLLWGGLGCGSTSGLPQGGDAGDNADLNTGPTREQACEDAVSAYCAKLDQCAPLLLKIAFGGAATCSSRGKLACSATPLPGSSQTPAGIEACTAALDALSCHDLFAGPVAACRPPAGSIANGSACGDDSQCQSTHCLKPSGSGCGTCGPAPVVGTSCANGIDCGGGLTCNRMMKCAAFVDAGAPCDDNRPCNPTLGCDTRLGTCQPLLAAGAACDPSGAGGACDSAHGFYCHAITRACTAVGLAMAGGMCGIVGTNYVICTGSSQCSVQGLATGTCGAVAADGAPCGSSSNVGCLLPAHCEAGICKVDSPASCM